MQTTSPLPIDDVKDETVYCTEFITFKPETDADILKNDSEDLVNSPSHYKDHYPIEVVDMIEAIMGAVDDRGVPLSGVEYGYLYNELKYRLRCGFKGTDNIEQDINKALWYNKKRKSLSYCE